MTIKVIYHKPNLSRPQPISTGQLNTLLRLHLQPINLIFFEGFYSKRMGNLILR